MSAGRWVALALLGCSPAWAVNKCEVEGRVVYQDAPCAQTLDTVAQGLARQQRVEAFHRRLDQMQLRGVGLVQRAPPTPPAAPPASADGDSAPLRRLSRADLEARRAAVDARLVAQTLENNERSRQALTQQLDAVQASCGGKLLDLPVVGMRDEIFRNCTLHARFGGATQIVAVEEDGVALRLYVFPRGKVERVYSVDGVVTSVRP